MYWLYWDILKCIQQIVSFVGKVLTFHLESAKSETEKSQQPAQRPPQLTTLDKPTKEGPVLRLLWRIQTAVAYQILFDWCNIIHASKSLNLMSSSFCRQMPKHA